MAARIMIVDDSIHSVQRLSDFLSELGHTVIHVARSGAEAVASYRTFKPDIVTMDIAMPGMSGIDATQCILQANPEARIIIVTSEGFESNILKALDAGAQGFVMKPLRKDKLSLAISSVLGKK